MKVISAAYVNENAGAVRLKVPVFGLLKRGGHVFTAAVKDMKADTLVPIIACKVQPDSIVSTDSYRSYDTLDITDFHHMWINHSKLFADKQNHINGIENFWNQAKQHLRKYSGIPRQNFHLLLKECEWRFNYGAADQLLKTLRECSNHTPNQQSRRSDPLNILFFLMALVFNVTLIWDPIYMLLVWKRGLAMKKMICRRLNKLADGFMKGMVVIIDTLVAYSEMFTRSIYLQKLIWKKARYKDFSQLKNR